MTQQIIYIASAEPNMFNERVTKALAMGYEPMFPTTSALSGTGYHGFGYHFSVFMKMPDAKYKEVLTAEEEALKH